MGRGLKLNSLRTMIFYVGTHIAVRELAFRHYRQLH